MKKTRSELRDIIIKIIYQVILYQNNHMKYQLEQVINENNEVTNDFVNETVTGIIGNLSDLTELANQYLNNWTLDRLGTIDQAILLLGLYELKYTEVPAIVAIDEALNLATKYSDAEVKNMINAVLDKYYHEK